jgi:hypothetical protein
MDEHDNTLHQQALKLNNAVVTAENGNLNHRTLKVKTDNALIHSLLFHFLTTLMLKPHNQCH